ncbi:MAG: hypothetical protein U0N15_03500 [Bifidobacterium choerinum]
MKRTNCFLNSACRGDGAKPVRVVDTAGPITWGCGDRFGYSVDSKAGSAGSFVEWLFDLSDVAGVEMVFSCEIGYIGAYAARGEVIQILGEDGVTLASIPSHKPDQREQLLRFTVPADGRVYIRFRGPQAYTEGTATLAVYEPQLETAATYDARGDTPKYFNGNTYPRNSGA